MAVDIFPKPSKNKHGYTSLNPFKHFLKKKELITPAETAEMLSVRNRSTKINLRISKMDLMDAGVLHPQKPQTAPPVEKPDHVVERVEVKSLDDGDVLRYPNETMSISVERPVPYNKDEQLEKDKEEAAKDDEKGKNGNEGKCH